MAELDQNSISQLATTSIVVGLVQEAFAKSGNTPGEREKWLAEFEANCKRWMKGVMVPLPHEAEKAEQAIAQASETIAAMLAIARMLR